MEKIINYIYRKLYGKYDFKEAKKYNGFGCHIYINTPINEINWKKLYYARKHYKYELICAKNNSNEYNEDNIGWINWLEKNGKNIDDNTYELYQAYLEGKKLIKLKERKQKLNKLNGINITE